MNVVHDPSLFTKIIIHRLVALVFSFSFTASIRLLVGDAFFAIGGGDIVFWLFLPISAGLCIAICALADAQRVRSAVRIQAMCLMLLAFYCLQMLVSGSLYPASFTLAIRILLDSTCLALQWLYILYIEKMFKPRERLLTDEREWSDQQLYQELRTEGHLLSHLQQNFKRLDTLALRGLYIIALILFILFGANRNAGATTIGMTALFAFSVVVLRTLLRLYDRELLYGGQGIKNAFDLSLYSIRSILILSAILTVFALLLSSNTALLPPTPFQYLLSLITRETVGGVPLPRRPPLESMTPSASFGEVIDSMGQSEIRTIVDLNIVMRLLGYFLLAVIAVAVLIFLFAPLFSSRFKQFVFHGRLRSLIKQFLKALRSMLKVWIHLSKPQYGKKEKKKSSSALAGAIQDRIRQTRNSRERRRLGRLAALFMKLIDWGEKKGISWRPDLAPAEYTDKLADTLGVETKIGNLLKTSGRLFEKALWAADPLTGSEEKVFREAVTVITQIP